MFKFYKLPLATAGLSLATGLACADVRYDFTALSSFPFQGESYTGSFSYVAPDFIASNTTIPAASLLQCSAQSSSGPKSCFTQEFQLNVIQGGPASDSLGFGVQVGAGAVWLNYYFNHGDFSTPGLHLSQLQGSEQAGTLLVTVLSAVPEPASWASAALGLAFLAGATRRSRGKH